MPVSGTSEPTVDGGQAADGACHDNHSLAEHGGAGRMAGTVWDVFQTGVPGGDLSSGAASAG